MTNRKNSSCDKIPKIEIPASIAISFNLELWIFSFINPKKVKPAGIAIIISAVVPSGFPTLKKVFGRRISNVFLPSHPKSQEKTIETILVVELKTTWRTSTQPKPELNMNNEQASNATLLLFPRTQLVKK